MRPVENGYVANHTHNRRARTIRQLPGKDLPLVFVFHESNFDQFVGLERVNSSLN